MSSSLCLFPSHTYEPFDDLAAHTHGHATIKFTLASAALLFAAAYAAPMPQAVDPAESAVLSSVLSQFPEIATLVSEFAAGETAAVKDGLASLEANPTFQSVVAANPTVSSYNAEVTSLLGGARRA